MPFYLIISYKLYRLPLERNDSEAPPPPLERNDSEAPPPPLERNDYEAPPPPLERNDSEAPPPPLECNDYEAPPPPLESNDYEAPPCPIKVTPTITCMGMCDILNLLNCHYKQGCERDGRWMLGQNS